MSVYISNMTFSESEFNGGDSVWKAELLYDYAKAKGYKPFDFDLRAVNLAINPFDCGNMYNFIFQCKRVANCDKTIPIILSDMGVICDGHHRICRAILDGDKTIKAIRMEKMPPPNYVESKTQQD